MKKFLDATEEEILEGNFSEQEKDVLLEAHQILLKKKIKKPKPIIEA